MEWFVPVKVVSQQLLFTAPAVVARELECVSDDGIDAQLVRLVRSVLITSWLDEMWSLVEVQ